MGSVFSSEKDGEMDSFSVPNKTRMSVSARSAGDGMETVSDSEPRLKEIPVLKTEVHQLSRQNFPPVNTKHKEPKFVPYEPYKAAVSPIIPRGKHKLNANNTLINNHLIQPLASKVIRESTESRLAETCTVLSEDNLSVDENIKDCVTTFVESPSWLQEKALLENKLQLLEEEKKMLESQFKLQTQVNTDLKKLLVASLGEDMQAKVQYMSEDKAKLGEHVLLYSQKLSQNNEELERILVEKNMWKSKFEAGSLLVDELASWKAVLSRKLNEAVEVTQGLLNSNHEVHQQLFHIFSTLHSVQEAFDPSSKRDLPCSQSPWNLSQLAGAVRSLSSDIQNRLLGSIASLPPSNRIEQVHSFTQPELLAQKFLDSIQTLPALTKLEVSQRHGYEIGAQACALLPHTCSKEPNINCCRQCSGKIRLV